MVGQIISHYRIVEKLGEGGMGVVYKAEDTKLKRTVALKFLAVHLLESEEHKARFLQEARSAALLEHPNICTVYEIDEVDGRALLAMAFLEGQTLKEKIAERPLPLPEALEIALQIAQGLQEAHQKGIVHRDIKPHNIILTAKGQVKIIDFGLVQLSDRTKLTATGTKLGTPAYMSPEQTEGKPADRRTDIWSLGVVLYEMVTGCVPFPGEAEAAVAYAILHTDPEPLTAQRTGVPLELDRIVGKTLSREPAQRYQHADDLLVDLRALVASRGTGSSLAAVRPPSRRKVVLAAGGALAALVATVAVYQEGFFSDADPESIDAIAVLPLENLSGNPEQEYFSDGLTEALITSLSRIGALRVTSRTSAMQYKGVRKSLPEIARELGVDAVVAGSVQKEGDHVRVSVQLIEGGTDRNIWAETYNREVSSVLALQSEVAQAIAQEIQVQLTPKERRQLVPAGTVNPTAYEAYLQGKSYLYRSTPEALEKAEEYFNVALEADPDSALAHSGLADLLLLSIDLSLRPPAEAGSRALAEARRAIELDPNLAQGYSSLGLAEFYYGWDWSGAEAAFRRALEISPSHAESHVHYGVFLTTRGRSEDAAEHMRRGLDLDPLNPYFQTYYGWLLLVDGDLDEAVVQLRDTAIRNPDMQMVHLCLLAALGLSGRPEEALAAAIKAWDVVGNREVTAALESGYRARGYREAMLRAAATLAGQADESYLKPHIVAYYFDVGGDVQRALDWLERGYRQREDGMAYLNKTPFSAELRGHPRFRHLIELLDLPLRVGAA